MFGLGLLQPEDWRTASFPGVCSPCYGPFWIPSRTLSHTSAQVIKLKTEHCLFHTCIFRRRGARLTFN